jgi:hypothetical protein
MSEDKNGNGREMRHHGRKNHGGNKDRD